MGQRQIRVTAVALLILSVIIGSVVIMVRTKGEIVLPTEGGYVNATVARNLFFYKDWGLSKYQFMPAASSLLYPILTGAVFFILGQHLVIPVLINLAAAIWLLITIHRWMIGRQWTSDRQMWLLAVAVGVLPVLVLDGTEYVVYLLLAFLFWTRCYDSWMQQLPLPRVCHLYASLLVATRCEGMLLVILMCILFFARQRRADALKLLLSGGWPIIIYGIICHIHQYAFVPMALVQIEGADWWLAQLSVLLLLGVTESVFNSRLAGSFLLFLAVGGFVLLARTSGASLNIYQTEYPVAGFLRRYCFRRTMAADHLGVTAYFTLGRKFALKNRSIPDSVIRNEGVSLIVLSDYRRKELAPPEWSKIATWQRTPDSLTFYTPDTGQVRSIRQWMDEYRYFLPASIHIEYD